MRNREKEFIAGVLAMITAIMVILACTALVASAKTAEPDYSGVNLEQVKKAKPLEGIVERKGHYYIYRRGRMLTGKVKYKGHWYYCHKTSSKDYPYGSMTRGMMRIESGNRWYAYKWDGTMYTKNVYHRKGPVRKILEVEIDPKTHQVKYVYGISVRTRGWRYSTAELRWQKETMYGHYKTVESMQSIPDWVDRQR